jgi:hypothetical protein
MEDFDISNYSFNDLKDILGIENEYVSREDIVSAVNHFMSSYELDEKMTRFLKEAQQKMIHMLKAEVHNLNDETFEFHKEDHGNHKVSTTLSKLIVVDSQYSLDTYAESAVYTHHMDRTHSLDAKTKTQPLTTHFTCHFTEPIFNILSYSLYSYTIPYTYYNIERSVHNNTFTIIVNNTKVIITVPDGNYGCDLLLSTINELMKKKGFSNKTNTFVHIVKHSGKIIFNFEGTSYNDDNNETILNDINTELIFFDTNETSKERIDKNDVKSNTLVPLLINQTLGWILGFRQQNYYMDPEDLHVRAESVLNIISSKYFVLDIDDFSNSHIKTNLIGIETNHTIKSVKLPTFLRAVEGKLSVENIDSVNRLQPKIKKFYKDNFPRSLNANQLYALNETVKNRGIKHNYLRTNFLSEHSFAIIPLKNPKHHFGEVYVEFGGSVQDNKRVFHGPVSITKLKVRLLNDRGLAVNLHGAEWSFVLKLEILLHSDTINGDGNNNG